MTCRFSGRRCIVALSGVSNFGVFSFLMFFFLLFLLLPPFLLFSLLSPIFFFGFVNTSLLPCIHSAFVTNPADVITTRIITQEVGSSSSSSSSEMSDTVTNKPLGVIEMGQLIYDEGGPSAFLKGWQARWVFSRHTLSYPCLHGDDNHCPSVYIVPLSYRIFLFVPIFFTTCIRKQCRILGTGDLHIFIVLLFRAASGYKIRFIFMIDCVWYLDWWLIWTIRNLVVGKNHSLCYRFFVGPRETNTPGKTWIHRN